MDRLEIRRAWWSYQVDVALVSAMRREGTFTAETANALAVERFEQYVREVGWVPARPEGGVGFACLPYRTVVG